MPELTVEINGREYQVACDDGQEEHLTKLARFVDKKMGELVGAVGQIGDARLLVMTGLLIADGNRFHRTDNRCRFLGFLKNIPGFGQVLT